MRYDCGRGIIENFVWNYDQAIVDSVWDQCWDEARFYDNIEHRDVRGLVYFVYLVWVSTS